MANCKICNNVVTDGMEICDDCSKELTLNDEQYLDQLLASVTGAQSEPYQHTEKSVETMDQPTYEYESILYTEEELKKQNSKDDDWNLLNQTMNKQSDDKPEVLEYNKEIPAEGALDEVESILMEDYGAVLQEIANGPDESDYTPITDEDSDQMIDQENYMDYLVNDEYIESQDDIMSISDDLVEEDMNNPFVESEGINSLDEDFSDLYSTQVSSPEAIVENEISSFDEKEFIDNLMETDFDDSIFTEEKELDSNIETIQTSEESKLEEDILPIQQDFVEPEAINVAPESEPKLELVVDDELSELDKLLGEVTDFADDFKLEHIFSDGSINEVDQEEDLKIDNSDILKKSLSAVSDLQDSALEDQFNSILPTEMSPAEANKGGFLKRLFSNVSPENPEEELRKEQEEEALAQEKKQQKEEQKLKKAALKEENKAKKVVLKENKQKEQAEEKEKRKKAREAIAAAYVPQGKINKAGAFVVFVFAACMGAFIIQGTSYASYHLSVKSAEKDFKNSRFDEAYETLSGTKLKEKDEGVYDKLQTIMIVKKELNSYYNFKRMDKELEALDSIIKGIDRYERYYANAKELKVDMELNSLKDEMVSILKDNYNLGEKDIKKLIDLEDAKVYTDRLTTIVKNITEQEEATKQLVQKNK